ncbi:MAG TPA: DNA-processing protein DprA [Chthonomonadaceae bacterium]|nr:DNA-processing protein DprA [Chthonomonadaceae bacterium]
MQTSSFHPEGEALRAWLRLANVPLSPRFLAALLTLFGNDPQAIFAADDTALEQAPGFHARYLTRLRDPAYAATDRQVAWIERHEVQLVLQGQPGYPRLLSEIPDPPALLFVQGTLAAEDRLSVGMVGSRHATPYGRATAERIARELAGYGLTVVSGGAVGIDAAAHRGALSAGGRTLAVLGCGLDVDYPRENRALFAQIAAQGALISEYPPGAQPEAWHFPLRNRIISGLSLGVLVVEAPKQSGALITSGYAAEHGRPILAVPGNIDRSASAGTNDLLKDGAILVTETADILRAFDMVVLPPKPATQFALELEEGASTPPLDSSLQASRKGLLSSLPDAQRKLLECLSLTPRHIDAIAQEAGLTSTQAGIEMTFLELSGLVRRLPGNTYILGV